MQFKIIWFTCFKQYGHNSLRLEEMKVISIGSNGLKEMIVVSISIDFCTLLTSVIVKVLFKLMQKAILKEYSESFNLTFI